MNKQDVQKINKNALHAAIVVNGLTKSGLADYLGISSQSLYKKMNGSREFSRSEIMKIMDILKISDDEVMNIFFRHEVS